MMIDPEVAKRLVAQQEAAGAAFDRAAARMDDVDLMNPDGTFSATAIDRLLGELGKEPEFGGDGV